MKEKVLSLGNSSSLIVIVSEPETIEGVERKPAVLFWNAGILHRVGPYRLYVDMSRRLAKLGFLAARFDLSGKGDSGPRRDMVPEKERVKRDVQEVMNLVTINTGIEKFVLIGLCSGADDAFPIAVLDRRVSGLVMLDGFGYRTFNYYVYYYLPRIYRCYKLESWKKFVVRKYNNYLSRSGRKVDDYIREFPPKKKARADILSLIERKVNLLFVYSGTVGEYYNYKGQFVDMFKPIELNEKLQVEYFTEATHIYDRLEDRNRLMSCVCDWMQKHYY